MMRTWLLAVVVTVVVTAATTSVVIVPAHAAPVLPAPVGPVLRAQRTAVTAPLPLAFNKHHSPSPVSSVFLTQPPGLAASAVSPAALTGCRANGPSDFSKPPGIRTWRARLTAVVRHDVPLSGLRP